jgi:hypothetical protein
MRTGICRLLTIQIHGQKLRCASIQPTFPLSYGIIQKCDLVMKIFHEPS